MIEKNLPAGFVKGPSMNGAIKAIAITTPNHNLDSHKRAIKIIKVQSISLLSTALASFPIPLAFCLIGIRIVSAPAFKMAL